jgi:hypothetical protein
MHNAVYGATINTVTRCDRQRHLNLAITAFKRKPDTVLTDIHCKTHSNGKADCIFCHEFVELSKTLKCKVVLMDVRG